MPRAELCWGSGLPSWTSKITAGEFQEDLLGEDIQVKEAEALRATIHMLVTELPAEIKGQTLTCKVDNQVLKAVWERKGTSQKLKVNCIGKQIFWVQFLGQFLISLQYVRSDNNVSDSFTRQSPGLEATLSNQVFKNLWEKWGALRVGPNGICSQYYENPTRPKARVLL